MFGFRDIVLCDTEFRTEPDGSLTPRCALFLELYSGRETRLWQDELAVLTALPFDIRNDLFVCFSAGAEIGVFLELDLPLHTMFSTSTPRAWLSPTAAAARTTRSAC